MGSPEAKALGIDATLDRLSRVSGGREVNAMVFRDCGIGKGEGEGAKYAINLLCMRVVTLGSTSNIPDYLPIS